MESEQAEFQRWNAGVDGFGRYPGVFREVEQMLVNHSAVELLGSSAA